MFTYSPVSESVKEKLKCATDLNFVKVIYNDPNPLLKDHQPRPVVIPGAFQTRDRAAKEFTIRKNDVWILGFAKTGMTWTSELATTLVNGWVTEQEEISKRCPTFESYAFGGLGLGPRSFWQEPDPNPNRRFFMSHLPLNLLPRGLLDSTDQKMIYVYRNPKDVAVSWYHYYVNLAGFGGHLIDVLDCYLSGENPGGSYFEHVDEFIKLSKVKTNLLVITYEELRETPIPVILRVAKHLAVPLTNEDAEVVADYINFDTMKNRLSSNRQAKFDAINSRTGKDFKFLRKGKIGSYKEEMPQEYIEKFNEEMKKWPALMATYPNF